MNTFGYTGKLENSAQIDCIYQNEAAQNFFLTKGDRNDAPSEASISKLNRDCPKNYLKTTY